MDFIFMLTRADQTVVACLDVIEEIADLGLRHIGFKDVGVDKETLRTLNRRITEIGATSYLEVVSLTPEAAINSARVAVEIGVDRLLGGSNVKEIADAIAGSGIAYFPFAGGPEGHPTRLRGSPQDIADDCRRFEAMGCAGVDLLAFRAVDADPFALVAAARRSLQGKLIVAGSIESAARITALSAAGVDAFTIGSAVFDGSFSPEKLTIRDQLGDILAACS